MFANYLWNPDAYDRTAALKSAMELLFGQGIYELLKPGAEALAYFDRYLLNIQPAILKENVQDLEAKIALAEDAVGAAAKRRRARCSWPTGQQAGSAEPKPRR